MTRREEFTAWICAQTGSAYVWGAQGHKVRRDGTVYMNQRKVSDNFESWVRQRENGEENARRAISGIRQRFAEGANEVTCYDCSGLIMAYIRDIKGYTTRDLSARGLFAIAKEKAKEELIPGDLVFRHNGEKITHVGVYIGSGYAVDARGRDSGVIKQRLDAAGWNRFASLEMLNEQGISAVDAAMPSYGRCTGKSVYVRSGAGGTYPILATAHRGDRLLALPEQNGWHRIAICCKGKLLTGYMSAKYIEYA